MAGCWSTLGSKVPGGQGRTTRFRSAVDRHDFVMAVFVGRSRARAALKLADELLDRLEVLSLADKHQVPASLRGLIGAVDEAATAVGVHSSLQADGYDVMAMMDDVYDLEDQLLPRCRVRAYPRIPLPAH